MNRIRYKKKQIFLRVKYISKPIFMSLIGRFDGKIKRNEKCTIEYNERGTKIQSNGNTPSWVMDSWFDTSEEPSPKVFKFRGANYKYTSMIFSYNISNGLLVIKSTIIIQLPNSGCNYVPF